VSINSLNNLDSVRFQITVEVLPVLLEKYPNRLPLRLSLSE